MLTHANGGSSTPQKRCRGVFYGYVIVAASLILLLVVFGVVYSYGVFFKPMSKEFGWSAAVTSGAYSLSIFVYGSLAIAAGRLNDRFGPRGIGMVCGGFLGLGLLLMSQVGDIWQLYLFYGVLVGVGISGWWITVISATTNWFVRRRGMMVGTVASGIGLGTLIVPPLVARLISNIGWRNSYLVVGATVLILSVVLTRLIKLFPQEMGLRPYGDDAVEKEDRVVAIDKLPFREVIRKGQYWELFATNFCYGWVLYTVMVHIVPHGIESGFSATEAADILAIIGLAGFAGRFVMGTVADRIGNLQGLVVSFALMSVASALLLAGSTLWMLFLFASVFGFAYAGQSALLSLVTVDIFGTRSFGVILGSLTLGFTSGGTIGPIAAGMIFDRNESYQAAFLISLFVSVAGLVVSTLLMKLERARDTAHHSSER